MQNEDKENKTIITTQKELESFLKSMDSESKLSEECILTITNSLKDERCELTEVALYGDMERLSENSVSMITEALKHPNCKLTTLMLYNYSSDPSKPDDKSIGIIAQALPACRLTTLKFEHMQISDEGIRLICDALKNPDNKLTSLSLERTELTDESARCLAETLNDPNCKLTALNMKGTYLSKTGTQYLLDTVKKTGCKLTELNFHFAFLNDPEIIPSIINIFNYPSCQLQSLDLCCAKLTTEDINNLTTILKKPSNPLRKLILRGYEDTEDKSQLLTEAFKNPNCKLTHLDLVWCASDIVCHNLAEAIKNPDGNLTSLYLRGTREESETDEGMRSILKALKNPHCKIKDLGLNQTRLSDESARMLAEILKSPGCKLEVLDISRNMDISDEATLLILDALKKNHSIKKLKHDDIKIMSKIKNILLNNSLTESMQNMPLELFPEITDYSDFQDFDRIERQDRIEAADADTQEKEEEYHDWNSVDRLADFINRTQEKLRQQNIMNIDIETEKKSIEEGINNILAYHKETGHKYYRQSDNASIKKIINNLITRIEPIMEEHDKNAMIAQLEKQCEPLSKLNLSEKIRALIFNIRPELYKLASHHNAQHEKEVVKMINDAFNPISEIKTAEPEIYQFSKDDINNIRQELADLARIAPDLGVSGYLGERIRGIVPVTLPDPTEKQPTVFHMRMFKNENPPELKKEKETKEPAKTPPPSPKGSS